ncbi:MAG: diguanylate cyclase, partial [Planctomycetota bacterium]
MPPQPPGASPPPAQPTPSQAPGGPLPSGEALQNIGTLLASLDEAAVPAGQSATGAEASSNAAQHELVRARLGIASSLFIALRCKHPATAAHSVRVALSASGWAATLRMPDRLRTQLELAALLHDVGKIGVPDRVLLKPGRLDQEEVQLVDRHLDMADMILSGAGMPDAIIACVTATAAWYDGSHRRVKLAGDNIPVLSRMLAIVDAFDAMTTDHVYRPARSRDRAVAELFECAGRQFDPALVKSFAEHFSRNQRELQDEVSGRWLAALADSPGLLPWSAPSAPRAPAPVIQTNPLLPFYQKLVDNTHDGVVFVDTGRTITQWNTGAERLTGVASGAALGRVLTPTLLDMADRTGKLVGDDECPVEQAIATGLQLMESVSVVGRNGHHVAVDLHAIPIHSEDGVLQGATVLLNDVSSEASLEEKCQALHAEMTRDPMTQVANRAEFDRMLAAFVDAHEETGLPCSLIMADIDFFKRINDTYGHQAGDEAIITFAKLLKSMCRSGDLVARYGGEEFAVLCADCNNASAAARAEEIRRKLAETPHSELGNKNITASFGVTELQAGDTPETMLRRSDRALLQAKDQGRNQVVQLGDGMTEPVEKKSWWPFA